MGKTCKEAVDEFLEPFGFPPLWPHDLIHVATGHTQLDETKDRPYLTHEAEQVAIIFQAVLMRDKDQYPNIEEISDGGKVPIFAEIISSMPRIMHSDFMSRQGYQPLSTEKMREHYYNAREMGRLIKEEFGKNLGEFTKEEMESIDIGSLEKLYEKATNKKIGRMGGSLER